MITKKEIMVILCELEARIDTLSGSIKRLQTKLNKIDKPEKKDTKKVK